MSYFDLCCVICDRIVRKDNLKAHYDLHTREEMIKELMSVSKIMAIYGEYA